MESNISTPNPGTPEAVALGCTCPVEENHHGKGYCRSPEGEILFWYNDYCPLHFPEKAKETK